MSSSHHLAAMVAPYIHIRRSGEFAVIAEAALGSRAILLLVVIGLLMALGSAYQAHRKVLKNIARHDLHETTDFDRWLIEIPAHLRQGADIVNDRFPNPPPAMLLLAPFTGLPRAWAPLPWALCKVGFAAVILWAVLRIVRNAGLRLEPAPLALLLAAWFWPVLGDMQEGQTNLLMLTPLALGLLAVQSPRASRQFGGGLLIALAVAIKVTPILFLPYAIIRRRRWIVWGIMAGLPLWLWAAPGLFVGFGQAWEWLRDWLLVMVVPYVGEGQVRVFEGQSLASFITRFLSHVPAFNSGSGGSATVHYVNILDLPLRVSQLVVRGVLVTLATGGAWWMRRRLPVFRSRRYLAEISAVTIFMLWASAWTWVPHYVTLIFALAAAAGVASDSRSSDRCRRRALMLLAVAAVLMLFTSDAANWIMTFGTDYARTFNLPLWASVALLPAILCDTWRCSGSGLALVDPRLRTPDADEPAPRRVGATERR